MATYAVGDVQGCLEPLQCLLEKVSFDPASDTLWSVGDIVNRGPRCLDTLRFFYELRDSVVMVLGNHDLHLLAVAAGARKANKSDTLDAILAAKDRKKLLKWLQQQPLVHREHGYALVHAGIPPQWSIAEAARYSDEVSAVLRSKRSGKYFSSMYGNTPAQWSDDLSGMKRLRVITNYLTRMRFCTKSGALDLESKKSKPDKAAFASLGNDLGPWFTHRTADSEKILFGHWASLQGKTGAKHAIGLDTGCVWGGKLSLYCLDTKKWTRCNCFSGKVPT